MNDSPTHTAIEAAPDMADAPIQEARLWRDERWTAEVIKNEDDDGWAVAMTLHGESEPALVGPWTMGRDKKNPKPLDAPAFHTLVKTASEVLRRHEQQLHAQLNKEVTVGAGAELVRVTLRIVPDEEYPYAVLTAQDESGQLLGEARVEASFKLGQASAQAWIESGYSASRW
ncbi:MULTISPECIES: hypothetical protein [unclassified Acidovorax]|uniref:hypothetical protein n=1 Tax=unclassified Acidovorax TaxID=2684926 RepID=UPI0028832603|nr:MULTISPECIES: hypothetical protein [unclassified Acidovorax]